MTEAERKALEEKVRLWVEKHPSTLEMTAKQIRDMLLDLRDERRRFNETLPNRHLY